MTKSEGTIYCTSQTADWSRCENKAARVVDGKPVCGLHGRMADRAARPAYCSRCGAGPLVDRTTGVCGRCEQLITVDEGAELAAREYDRPATDECTTRLYNGTTCYRVATVVVDGRGYCGRHNPAPKDALTHVSPPTFTRSGKRRLAPVDKAGSWSHLDFVPTHATRPVRIEDRVYCDACGSKLELRAVVVEPLAPAAALAAELEANGGHLFGCEGSCADGCPIKAERDAFANERARRAQVAWDAANPELRARRDRLVVKDPGTGRGSCSSCGVAIGNYHEAYCAVYRELERRAWDAANAADNRARDLLAGR